MKSLLNLALLLSIWAPLHIQAADWPNWRGPTYDGISQEKDWKISAEPKVLWEAEVGLGFSSFVVSKNKVLTTGHADGKDTVWCLNTASGKVIWKHEYPAELGDKYYEGGTSNTPTIEGERAYHLSRWGDLFCYELATGKVLWEHNVQKETDSTIPDWGFAGAPLLQGDRLILNVGKAGLAVDKNSGNILWKSSTESAGYSTPYPLTLQGSPAVIVSSTEDYSAVKVSDGTPIWSYRWNTRYGVNASDPILQGSELFISTGYNKGCTLLKLSASQPEKVWENRVLKNQFNSSILSGKHLYGIDGDQNGRCSLKCVEWATGEMVWEEKSIGFGSLMAADGRLIVLTEKGELVIVKITPDQYEEISRTQVLSGRCWSVPVLANGQLFVRNAPGKVLCLNAH